MTRRLRKTVKLLMAVLTVKDLPTVSIDNSGTVKPLPAGAGKGKGR